MGAAGWKRVGTSGGFWRSQGLTQALYLLRLNVDAALREPPDAVRPTLLAQLKLRPCAAELEDEGQALVGTVGRDLGNQDRFSLCCQRRALTLNEI